MRSLHVQDHMRRLPAETLLPALLAAWLLVPTGCSVDTADAGHGGDLSPAASASSIPSTPGGADGAAGAEPPIALPPGPPQGDGGSIGPCDTSKPFGAAMPVAGLGKVYREPVTLSPDERTIYYSTCVDRSGSYCAPSLLSASRAAVTAAFGTASFVVDFESGPAISADGLFLFASTFSGPLYYGKRSSLSTPFTPAYPGQLPSVLNDSTGTTVTHYRQSASEVWHTQVGPPPTYTRYAYVASFTGAAFGTPVKVELGGSAIHARPSEDGRTLVFASDRPGGKGGIDLYITSRATASGPFDPPQPIAELNTPGTESSPWLSADGCRLYFLRGQFSGAQTAAAQNQAEVAVARRPK